LLVAQRAKPCATIMGPSRELGGGVDDEGASAAAADDDAR
jgi:hypothetical protein